MCALHYFVSFLLIFTLKFYFYSFPFLPTISKHCIISILQTRDLDNPKERKTLLVFLDLVVCWSIAIACQKKMLHFVVLVPFQRKLGDQVVMILLLVKGIQIERRNGWKFKRDIFPVLVIVLANFMASNRRQISKCVSLS